MTETVLVTGGAGYVGSHVCFALAERGYRPVVVDDLSEGHRHAVRFGPFEPTDIRAGDLSDIFARHRPIAVVHAAAKSEVAASFRDPGLYHQVNVVGTRCVVRACKAASVPHLVMLSSAAVYGGGDGAPLHEDVLPQPASPYGLTKLSGEAALRDDCQDAVSWAVLRLFNVAGAAPAAGLGEAHRVETHLIPLAVRAALGRTEPLPLYGSAYSTPDGSAVRDYVHVMDAARAVVQTLDYLCSGGANATFNVGSGIGTSVLQIVRTVERVAGSPVPLRFDGFREGDTAVLVADISRASQILGFHAQRTVEDIVRDVLLWEQVRDGAARRP